MVVWETRRRPGNAAAELAGVVFGCLCLMLVVALMLWVEFRQLQMIALMLVFGTALTARAVGTLRGRVVLHAEEIEVRLVRTRRYRRDAIRSVELIEGRVEITPDGWVRRLPVPRRQAATAYDDILTWWDRSAQAPPETR